MFPEAIWDIPGRLGHRQHNNVEACNVFMPLHNGKELQHPTTTTSLRAARKYMASKETQEPNDISVQWYVPSHNTAYAWLIQSKQHWALCLLLVHRGPCRKHGVWEQHCGQQHHSMTMRNAVLRRPTWSRVTGRPSMLTLLQNSLDSATARHAVFTNAECAT
jgi:hypothetical protein